MNPVLHNRLQASGGSSVIKLSSAFEWRTVGEIVPEVLADRHTCLDELPFLVIFGNSQEVPGCGLLIPRHIQARVHGYRFLRYLTFVLGMRRPSIVVVDIQGSLWIDPEGRVKHHVAAVLTLVHAKSLFSVFGMGRRAVLIWANAPRMHRAVVNEALTVFAWTPVERMLHAHYG